jgi:tripartite-type tricarboxylate transporter receptor subunit TctC
MLFHEERGDSFVDIPPWHESGYSFYIDINIHDFLETYMGDITSFALDPKSRKALDELRSALNASSNAEVIRRALKVLSRARNREGGIRGVQS